MTLSTRRLVLGFAAVLLATPAMAKGRFEYRGWRFDLSAVKGPLPDDLVASFHAQIDIVEDFPTKPAIKDFWRKLPIEVSPEVRGGGPGTYGPAKRRLVLGLTPQSPDNPVFLHELIHAYHHQRLVDGFQNRDVIKLWEEAKAGGAFPVGAYMLKNQGEFLAMCASVVLWGKAARPPSTRARVREALPATYAWIVREFGFTGA